MAMASLASSSAGKSSPRSGGIGWFGTHLIGPDGKIHFWWDMLIVIGFSIVIYVWAVLSALPENRVDGYIRDVYPPEGELLDPAPVSPVAP